MVIHDLTEGVVLQKLPAIYLHNVQIAFKQLCIADQGCLVLLIIRITRVIYRRTV